MNRWTIGLLGAVAAGLAVAALAIWQLPAPTPNGAAQFGRFEGTVEAQWLEDGRNMRLLTSFAFVEPNGKRWEAPAGAEVNGASIPQAFWSMIGGPFEGAYRNASVVHDVACVECRESWEDVHRMFYQACRCNGVSEAKAKLLYWAVYHFGPRWASRSVDNGTKRLFSLSLRPEPDEASIRSAVEFIDAKNPSLEDLESLDFAVPVPQL